MMMRYLMLTLLMLAGFHLLPVEAKDLSEVYVTTQDYAALRAGPGRHWDRLAVLPHSVTLRATGRTVDAQWIQVAYEGPLEPGARTEFTVGTVTYGWVAYYLLTWTGDILQLPIDGIITIPIAREAGPTIVLVPGDYAVYAGDVIPAERIANPITTPVTVEVTGRLGSADGGYFWLQFKYNRQYYWIPTWVIVPPRGYRQLPDAAYLYPYGRLLTQLQTELRRASGVLDDIGGRWRALDAGRPTTCNKIPENFALRKGSFTPADLNREPLYGPTAAALESAQDSINAALQKFRDACAGERAIAASVVQAGLNDVREAERYLNVAQILLVPLEQQNPLLQGKEEATPSNP
jgi:hypothetical protein